MIHLFAIPLAQPGNDIDGDPLFWQRRWAIHQVASMACVAVDQEGVHALLDSEDSRLAELLAGLCLEPELGALLLALGGESSLLGSLAALLRSAAGLAPVREAIRGGGEAFFLLVADAVAGTAERMLEAYDHQAYCLPVAEAELALLRRLVQRTELPQSPNQTAQPTEEMWVTPIPFVFDLE